MGASVTVLQANQLPAVLEREQFDILTKKLFKSTAYDQFADHNGKVSRERLLEIVSMTDCYLSHEWGIDSQGRDTTSRVRKISKFLQSKGLFTNFDEGKFGGLSSADMLKKQIQSAQCVIVCMTERYFYQLTLPTYNPSKTEFYEIMDNRELRCIIPVMMEKAAFSIPDHIAQAYPQFMSKTHLDFTTFADISNDDAEQLSDLYLYVTRCIRPLRDGGLFKQQRNHFLSTITGRHYKWLLDHVSKFDHKLSLKYGEILAAADIESATRLWQLTQHDTQFLQKLGIPEIDALAIRMALKDDLMANFDTVNAKRVDAQIEAQNAAMQAETNRINQRTSAAVDMRTKYSELKCMSIEDEYSRGLREQIRMDEAENAFRRGREAILQQAEEQQRRYESTLELMREAHRQRVIDNDELWRHEGFLSIGRVTEPIPAAGLLYKLFIKIDRATAHLRNREVSLDDAEQVADLPEEYQQDFHFKRHRVQTFIDRATAGANNMKLVVSADGADSLLSADTTSQLAIAAGRDDATIEEKNSRLVFLLQEAAYICRAIVNVARGNPLHVAELAEGGAVKLLMALLAQVYLFSCPFESLFMPMSFHHLLMPSEVLWAIRYLVKCDPGRRNVNPKVAFLFGEAGAIDLCMDIVRFHLNDMNVASVAIELLYVLVDLPGSNKDNPNLQRLLGDPANLILLMVVLEKYQEYTSPVALALHSALIGIVALAAVTTRYEGPLRVYRAHLVVPVLNNILPQVNESSDPELCCRLCGILSNLFLSQEYQDSLYFTSDFVPKNPYISYELSKHVNYRVAMRFIKSVLTSFPDHEAAVLSAVVALGDLTFNQDKVKKEAFRMKLPDALVKVLKVRTKRLNNAHPKWDSVTESIELGVDAIGVREVLYEGLITAANVIIVPPFLTFDTRTPESGLTLEAESDKAQRKSPAGTVTAAALGDAQLPAAVAPEPESAFTHFLKQGMAELVMDVVTRYQEDRVLMRALLVFVNKFVYRGRYASTQRLVTLGFCDQILRLMKRYAEDEEVYMLCVMVVTGLLAAHPTLVGAARRLMPSELCELLTSTMRSQCALRQWSHSRDWTHFSYPYVCRVCVVHCTAAYCCLTTDAAYKAEALERFRSAGFHGMLLCPPVCVQDGLTLETAVVLPGRGAGESLLPSQKQVTSNSHSYKSEAAGSLVPADASLEAAPSSVATVGLQSAEAEARQRMMIAGVFHTPNAAKGRIEDGGISSATLAPEEYAGCVRNVEYMAYMPRREKDHVMSTLFTLFDVY